MSTVLTNDSSVTGIQCMHTSLSLAYSHTSAVDKVGSLHSDTLGNWSYQGIKHKFILWGEKVKRESTFDLHENGGSLFKNANEMCVTRIQFKELVAEGRNRFYGGKVGISLATASVAFG